MKFTETPLGGAFLIEIEAHLDARGFFARTACMDEFALRGLNGAFVQQSVSWNPRRGTLRGLHYQAAPAAEDKLVRATRGGIFDVIVDIRPASATFGQWYGVELTAENHRQFYIPKGFAHGFQTLEPNTEVLYEMTERFQPGAGRGISWNDPTLDIRWPEQIDAGDRSLLSHADAAHPFLADIDDA